MNENLIGPFPMSDPPVRVGWYCVATHDGKAGYWWDGDTWFASDDPLDYTVNFESSARWYGQAAPSHYHRGGIVDLKPDEVPAILSAGGDTQRIHRALANVDIHLEQDDGLEDAP